MYALVSLTARLLKHIIPESIADIVRPFYHRVLSFGMAFAYGFPARRLVVLGVTGTKGKSTTAEMLFAMLRRAGYTTALLSTIRFAVEDDTVPNLHKMTLPGRGFAQAFMRKAVNAGCTHIVIELTSESVLQYRTSFLNLDGLIVTNIQPEHIERHGSFENYVLAKRSIVHALACSNKPKRVLVANADDEVTRNFLNFSVTAIPFSESELKNFTQEETRSSFQFEQMPVSLPLPGAFNALNALAAMKLAEAFGVPLATCAEALESLPPVRGRVERIDAGQPFVAVVDYAHTPDSLRALYSAFTARKICVLGNTGGGRDAWKRPEMGKIADEYCDRVILTNEDPYDEDPRAIVEAMARGMKRVPDIILDRREAIRAALRAAGPGDAVLISGKGTDPYIMGPRGAKEPWSDASVVREELEQLRK
jgi:UDP-N-acetylmuramoyl-L-alanyl-D-glutamate--2,6-diaminopimelate ligase